MATGGCITCIKWQVGKSCVKIKVLIIDAEGPFAHFASQTISLAECRCGDYALLHAARGSLEPRSWV